MASALQTWVEELPLMQQTVLLTAIRGPDGVNKQHVVKLLLRWFRRCILVSAFDRAVLDDPRDQRGGSFTGPSLPESTGKTFMPMGNLLHDFGWEQALDSIVDQFIGATDELPHHFLAHFRHASEILGYKHPTPHIRTWWNRFYRRQCDDAHLNAETEQQLDYRLGDNREQWLKAGDRSSCGRDDCVMLGTTSPEQAVAQVGRRLVNEAGSLDLADEAALEAAIRGN